MRFDRSEQNAAECVAISYCEFFFKVSDIDLSDLAISGFRDLL